MDNIIDGKSQLLDDFNHNVIAKKIAQSSENETKT